MCRGPFFLRGIDLKQLILRFCQGRRIILQGLSRESLNGRTGICQQFIFTTERWLVKLDGSDQEISVPEHSVLLYQVCLPPSQTRHQNILIDSWFRLKDQVVSG